MSECPFCGGKYDLAAMAFHRGMCSTSFADVLPARIKKLESDVAEMRKMLSQINERLGNPEKP